MILKLEVESKEQKTRDVLTEYNDLMRHKKERVNIKYLIEEEGDEALIKGKGQVGFGFLAFTSCNSLAWDDNEGSIDLRKIKMIFKKCFLILKT